jgi:hypothetical protein
VYVGKEGDRVGLAVASAQAERVSTVRGRKDSTLAGPADAGSHEELAAENVRLKEAMNRLGDELRMVSVRLCNATIGPGDIARMLASASAPAVPRETK